MATYKQKLPRFHVTRDSDSEESEQEWVKFSTSNKPIERRLVNNVSDEEDWHVLSDTSPVEESIPSFESNSEIASGCSDYDSEPYYVQDENAHSLVLPEGQDNSPSFVRKMPSHDGTGNFFDTALSDGSNYDSSTSLMDSDLALRRHVGAKIDHIESTVSSSYLDQSNESLPNDLRGSIISDKASLDARHTIPIGRRFRSSIRESWITKFRNVFRIEEEDEQITQASQQIYHKFAESASSAAKFELGDLGNTNPIRSLANIGNENANPITHTTITTQCVDTSPNKYSQTNHDKFPASNVGSCIEKNASIMTRFGNRLAMSKDPLTISFAPTISKDMLNEMISTENVNNADHQKEQSASPQISSQPDKNSLLSTVWTTVCRITNNIIVSDDIDPVSNDSTNLTFASSNHNTHGLASIITGIGENNYDTSYPPFGNHLTLSELFPSLHNYRSHYSSSSTPSTSSYNIRRSSATSSNNTNILLSPVSSSTSLKSFTSRAGSECGLESSRCISSTTLEAPLVL